MTTAEKKTDIYKGLVGVTVDETKVSKVMPEINSLTYRGYPVQDLAEKYPFEDVAYLLWYGELPSPEEAKIFRDFERANRQVSPKIYNAILNYPKSSHPMDTTRTSVSLLALEDPLTNDNSIESNQEKAVKLMAKLPTMVAADFRARKGLKPIPPQADLSFSENFFYMCFGEKADKEFVKAFDVTMTLYAEHGFNASTFTARVIASSLSDMHASVVGAISSLKGPLHGGANEAVMNMFLEIGRPENAKEWMLKKFRQKEKIMGFGHRVYRKGDSRVPTMKKYYEILAKKTHRIDLLTMSNSIEDIMVREKNIYPNLDYPAGPAYYLMGFDVHFFTPFFVMSRITGWTAHIMEQLENNRLIRPLAEYTGVAQRKLPSLK